MSCLPARFLLTTASTRGRRKKKTPCSGDIPDGTLRSAAGTVMSEMEDMVKQKLLRPNRQTFSTGTLAATDLNLFRQRVCTRSTPCFGGPAVQGTGAWGGDHSRIGKCLVSASEVDSLNQAPPILSQRQQQIRAMSIHVSSLHGAFYQYHASRRDRRR